MKYSTDTIYNTIHIFVNWLKFVNPAGCSVFYVRPEYTSISSKQSLCELSYAVPASMFTARPGLL